MPRENEFDEELRARVAKNIPCIHMPGLLLAERALLVVKEYLNESLFEKENIKVIYQENLNKIHTLEYIK